MSTRFKIFGLFVIAINTAYLGWLYFNVTGILGWLLLFAEFMIASLTFFFLINHWSQRHVRHTHLTPSGSVDIFLPIVDEPIGLFEKTVKAATGIDYENKKLYILDDGTRKDIEELAAKYGAVYLNRKIHNNRKAGNLNYGLENSKGDFILVLDADQIAESNIIRDLLGYFSDDKKLAIVTTRQRFDVPKNNFNHDILFYEHMQTGKNADNAAISCGSGVFYRRSALETINGFPTWNVVEDLYTSYVLHAHGYKSIYINKPYTLGLMPSDLSGIYKQRGNWAVDTLRLFFRRSPLFHRGLTLRQRLHYFEIAWAYIVSAVAVPILFMLPPLTLFLDQHIILHEEIYMSLRIPSLAAILYFYFKLAGNNFVAGQWWASLFVVNIKALFLSIIPLNIKYRVTSKLAGVGKRDIALILPHTFLILFGFAAIFWRMFFLDNGVTSFTGINMIWITLMIFWFYPVILKGLKKE